MRRSNEMFKKNSVRPCALRRSTIRALFPRFGLPVRPLRAHPEVRLQSVVAKEAAAGFSRSWRRLPQEAGRQQPQVAQLRRAGHHWTCGSCGCCGSCWRTVRRHPKRGCSATAAAAGFPKSSPLLCQSLGLTSHGAQAWSCKLALPSRSRRALESHPHRAKRSCGKRHLSLFLFLSFSPFLWFLFLVLFSLSPLLLFFFLLSLLFLLFLLFYFFAFLLFYFF